MKGSDNMIGGTLDKIFDLLNDEVNRITECVQSLEGFEVYDSEFFEFEHSSGVIDMSIYFYIEERHEEFEAELEINLRTEKIKTDDLPKDILQLIQKEVFGE